MKKIIIPVSAFLFAASFAIPSAAAEHAVPTLPPEAAALVEKFQVSFDDGWRFHRVEHFHPEPDPLFKSELAVAVDFDDSNWERVDLPHDFSYADLHVQDGVEFVGPYWSKANQIWTTPGVKEKGALGASYAYMLAGMGWYRKTFQVPEVMRGKKVQLLFDAVQRDADFWLNGTHIGFHSTGFPPFVMDLTPALKQDGDNVLVVRVNNNWAETIEYYGSGITRNVLMQAMGEVNLGAWEPFFFTKSIAENKAVLGIQSDVRNDGDADAVFTITHTVIDKNNAVALETKPLQKTVKAGETLKVEEEHTIANPLLWDLDNPNLYKAVTTVMVGKEATHVMATTFGIRTVTADAVNGFRLNGKKVILDGTALAPGGTFCVGAACFLTAEIRKQEVMKRYGFNTFRVNHRPSNVFLEACDRVGMLVPYSLQQHGVYDAYKWRQEIFDEVWQADLTASVKRGRNHPSVVMYFTQSMDPSPVLDTLGFTQKMAALIRTLDPTTLVSRMTVLPYEATVNWLDEPQRKWTWEDIMNQAEEIYPSLDVVTAKRVGIRYHEKHPESVVYMYDEAPSKVSEWREHLKNPWNIGGSGALNFLSWTYLGECAGFPNRILSFQHINHFDYTGFPRFTSYEHLATHNTLFKDKAGRTDLHLVAEVPYSNTPKLTWNCPDEMATWSFPGFDGKMIKVKVYTSCDEVKLLLNGGQIKSGKPHECCAVWDIPYAPGTLTAIGCNDGEQVAEQTLVTAGKATTIQLTAENPVITANNQDLSFVVVTLTDDNGVWSPGPIIPENPKVEGPYKICDPCTTFNDKYLHFSVEGPGKIIGIENGFYACLESIQKPEHSTWQGRCLVAIRATHEPGEIVLKATVEGLKDGVVTIVSNSK